MKVKERPIGRSFWDLIILATTGLSLGCTGSSDGTNCVDLVGQPSHCGACEVACDAGQVCEGGVCTDKTSENDSAGGGSAAGGNGTGGGATGGSESSSGATGGGGTGGGATGAGGTGDGTGGSAVGGGATGGSGTGGGSQSGEVFSECRFHFGTIRDFAIDHAEIREQIDFFTPGWMGLSNTFDQQYVCDDVNGVLAGKVPVVVSYVSAFYGKHQGLNDCNVGTPDLCTYGAGIIKDNLEAIVDIYRNYAQGYANCLDPDQPVVFEMEPDWYQYTLSSQTDPMTPAEAGQIMSQYVLAMKEHLPNAHFSMDISPWVPPNNGSDHGATWYQNFDMSLFSFINTSGGGTEADNDQIRSSNNMTWAGVSGVTNLPVLGDTGYGVNGASAGHDSVWDDPANINARMADGVVGISQYNPNSNWGSTIATIRDQLGTPKFCP